MSNEIATTYSLNDLERMASAIAASKLFGLQTPQQALGLMLLCQAEGMHPAIAARDYHIIQGRPALKADAMLARFQHAGGKVEWSEYTPDRVTGVFSHPSGGRVSITWTLEMARSAGLTGNKTWQQYPRQLLRARVISEGIRTVYPAVLVGVYAPEEVQDFTPSSPAPAALEAPETPIDVTEPLEVLEAPPTNTDPAQIPGVRRGANPPNPDGPCTKGQFINIQRKFSEDLQLGGDKMREVRLEILTAITGLEVESSKHLTSAQAEQCIAALRRFSEAASEHRVNPKAAIEFWLLENQGSWSAPEGIVAAFVASQSS